MTPDHHARKRRRNAAQRLWGHQYICRMNAKPAPVAVQLAQHLTQLVGYHLEDHTPCFPCTSMLPCYARFTHACAIARDWVLPPPLLALDNCIILFLHRRFPNHLYKLMKCTPAQFVVNSVPIFYICVTTQKRFDLRRSCSRFACGFAPREPQKVPQRWDRPRTPGACKFT